MVGTLQVSCTGDVFASTPTTIAVFLNQYVFSQPTLIQPYFVSIVNTKYNVDLDTVTSSNTLFILKNQNTGALVSADVRNANGEFSSFLKYFYDFIKRAISQGDFVFAYQETVPVVFKLADNSVGQFTLTVAMTGEVEPAGDLHKVVQEEIMDDIKQLRFKKIAYVQTQEARDYYMTQSGYPADHGVDINHYFNGSNIKGAIETVPGGNPKDVFKGIIKELRVPKYKRKYEYYSEIAYDKTAKVDIRDKLRLGQQVGNYRGPLRMSGMDELRKYYGLLFRRYFPSSFKTTGRDKSIALFNTQEQVPGVQLVYALPNALYTIPETILRNTLRLWDYAGGYSKSEIHTISNLQTDFNNMLDAASLIGSVSMVLGGGIMGGTIGSAIIGVRNAAIKHVLLKVGVGTTMQMLEGGIDKLRDFQGINNNKFLAGPNSTAEDYENFKTGREQTIQSDQMAAAVMTGLIWYLIGNHAFRGDWQAQGHVAAPLIELGLQLYQPQRIAQPMNGIIEQLAQRYGDIQDFYYREYLGEPARQYLQYLNPRAAIPALMGAYNSIQVMRQPSAHLLNQPGNFLSGLRFEQPRVLELVSQSRNNYFAISLRQLLAESSEYMLHVRHHNNNRGDVSGVLDNVIQQIGEAQNLLNDIQNNNNEANALEHALQNEEFFDMFDVAPGDEGVIAELEEYNLRAWRDVVKLYNQAAQNIARAGNMLNVHVDDYDPAQEYPPPANQIRWDGDRDLFVPEPRLAIQFGGFANEIARLQGHRMQERIIIGVLAALAGMGFMNHYSKSSTWGSIANNPIDPVAYTGIQPYSLFENKIYDLNFVKDNNTKVNYDTFEYPYTRKRDMKSSLKYMEAEEKIMVEKILEGIMNKNNDYSSGLLIKRDDPSNLDAEYQAVKQLTELVSRLMYGDVKTKQVVNDIEYQLQREEPQSNSLSWSAEARRKRNSFRQLGVANAFSRALKRRIDEEEDENKYYKRKRMMYYQYTK